MTASRPPCAQRGATLVITLIMLALLTILAVATLRVGRGSLQMSGNAQARAVAQDAAQQIINQIISNKTFAEAPTNVLDNSNCPASYNAPPNSRCIDVHGDGKTVVLVALSPAPRCVQMRPIPSSELDLTRSEDLGCTQGLNNQTSGIVGGGAPNSLCANTLWELSAQASDPVTGAQASVVQGVSLRVSTDTATTSCP